MTKILTITLLFFAHTTLLFAQKSGFNTIVSDVEINTDKANKLVILAIASAQKCAKANNAKEVVKYAMEAVLLSEESKKYANAAEKSADGAEIELEKAACATAAAEADDAEDYCRQLGYYTYEMYIYAKKAAAETDMAYVRSYILKMIHHAEDASEAARNVTIELEEALKDWEACK